MTIVEARAVAPPPSREARSIVAAFDFDGTITTRDTFVPFLFFAFGRRRVIAAFLGLAWEALFVVLGLSSRDRLKEKIVNRLFSGESALRLQTAGVDHAQRVQSWIRPAASCRIHWHKERGHRLVMVSASLDLYLEDVADALGFDDLLCTRPSVTQNAFDGFLTGGNCRGPEKVRRLQVLLGNLKDHDLYAYGDSEGDREMLAAADHAYLRAFEPGGALAGPVDRHRD